MLRPKFKNRANKSKTKEDIKKYKKQRNKVTKLNKKLEKVFFRENEPRGNNVKNFWECCKPYFTNKNIGSKENIILIENDIIQSWRYNKRRRNNRKNYFIQRAIHSFAKVLSAYKKLISIIWHNF